MNNRREWCVVVSKPTLWTANVDRHYYLGRTTLSPIHQIAAAKHAIESSDTILNHLTTRQYLQPQAPVQDVLSQTVEMFGCCPEAITRGLTWLSIEPTKPIGRLRRSELVQLAKAVHRFWVQNVKADQGVDG